MKKLNLWKIITPTILIIGSVSTTSAILSSCAKSDEQKVEFGPNDSVTDIVNNKFWEQYVSEINHIFSVSNDNPNLRDTSYVHISNDFLTWNNAVNCNEGMLIYFLKFWGPSILNSKGYNEFKADWTIQDTKQKLKVEIYGKKANGSWNRFWNWTDEVKDNGWKLDINTKIPEYELDENLKKTVDVSTDISNAGNFTIGGLEGYGIRMDPQFESFTFYDLYFPKKQFINMSSWPAHNPLPIPEL